MIKRESSPKQISLVGFLVRYLILLVIALIMSFSDFFYDIFLKLTIYPTAYLLNFFYITFIFGTRILIQAHTIEIIPACVAVSAYFLFFILNLSTPMTAIKRIGSILFLFISLLFVNILRIFVLSLLLVNNYVYFDAVHKFIWYFMNIIIVVGLWFLTVFLFKIKNIPVYSDFKQLIGSLKNKDKLRVK